MLLFYIKMSIVKNYVIISLQLISFSGSCNTLGNLSNRVCVPNETKDLNLHVFNMIAGIKESRTFTKPVSCKCECKFNCKKRNSNQKWNNNKCLCECKNPKNHRLCKKVYF